jgi:PfaB family protein
VETGVKAYSIDEVNIPLGRFRIPPNELKDMLPQQLLMLEVAANAIDDAGITEEKRAELKSAGVYIGIGLDMNTSNFHLRWILLPKARQWAKQLGLDLTETELQAWVNDLRHVSGPAMNANRTMGALGGIVASRVARAFDIGGPSFTLSSEESSGLRSLEAGVRALQGGDINTAIVGAVDLASDIRAIAGFADERSENFVIGEGAAAVILKRYDDALQDGDRIYSVIKGLGAAGGEGSKGKLPAASSFEKAVERSTVDAGVELDSIGLVEMCGNPGISKTDGEAKIIQHLFKNQHRDIPCAISNVAEDIGQSGAAAALAAIVKTSLCLHQRILPASAGLNIPETDLKNDTALFAPAETQYWLRDRQGGACRALVNAFSIDGNCLSTILEGVEEGQKSLREDPLYRTEALFSICADEKYNLIDSLQRLRGQAGESRDRKIQEIARHWWAQEKTNQHKALAVSVIASDLSQLIDLLKQAQNHVERDESIATANIFYAAEPVAGKARLAFVFPGSGSHFIGMGREMSAHWPEVLNRLDKENLSLASQFARSRFWTQKSTSGFSHEDYIFGQVWLGSMVSDVIASFSIKPDAVIGYCLGETVGLFATRTWNDRDLMLSRMRETRLFTNDLGGSCDAVRECWNAAEDEKIDWQLGVIDRPADEVRTALRDRSRVYLLIINTPGECIIGGDHSAVQELVKDLNCGFHPLEGVTTVHCEVVKPVESAYRELHLFHTTPPEGVAFYSGIAGSQYQVTTENAADSIVRQALETFDYTKLINAAYDDGVRIFIEMGPGASCSRMIGQILGDREHIARSVCVNGQSDVGNVLRLLAQLNAERIPLDLSSLYIDAGRKNAYADHNKISIEVGKKPFSVPMPPRQSSHETETVQKPVQAGLETDRAVELFRAPNIVKQTDPMSAIVEQMLAVEAANAEAQDAFLKVSNGIAETMGEVVSLQMSLMQSVSESALSNVKVEQKQADAVKKDIAFDRSMCMEFAIGSIARMLGPQFTSVDSFPTRVRLPDEPLMLVDRIIEVEGEACSMSHGRVVTEHDVFEGAWYLDAGRIPTCIAVEAGQADLFLSGYLGIDLQTHGLAVYRLLDAEVCFHGPLPQAGQIIKYDIYIDHFFRQGDTWLFRFGFDGTVNGQPLITMRNGCAGFFTQAELDAGRGIVRTSLETRNVPGTRKDDWSFPVAMNEESYSDEQINALRQGDLPGCFGAAFESLSLKKPAGLPGGKMTLVHRILSLQPEGGRFGLGIITGEADIHPDDWFLTCHFVDDQVMPGTLMYECCLHTLRVYLLRMGWVGEADEFVYEPVVGVTSKLKCRGQVLATTKKVQYEISLKEIGYTEDRQTPYVIADALMYADGKAIVQMSNMSLQLTGLNRQRIESIWADAKISDAASVQDGGKVLFD